MSNDYRIPDEEWKQRELCPDGNCIGVIGPDGRCKECGQPGKGGPVTADQHSDKADDEILAEEADANPSASAEEDAEAETEASNDDDWANRRLCPDGNCIGVIGPDGKCKECGRPADPVAND